MSEGEGVAADAASAVSDAASTAAAAPAPKVESVAQEALPAKREGGSVEAGRQGERGEKGEEERGNKDEGPIGTHAPPPAPPPPPAATQNPAPADDRALTELKETLGKYKRLLSLARRSIEENQRAIGEKDGIIHGLEGALEAAERASQQSAAASRAGLVGEPRALLRRVWQGDTLWCLFEYDSNGVGGGGGVSSSKAWKSFPDEGACEDYIRKDAGDALIVPPVSLSPQECAAVRDEANEKVAKIREEFRRYRVKAELARKQKDAEVRLASMEKIAEKSRRISGSQGSMGSAMGGDVALTNEITKLQAALADQDEMWRQAYDKQVRETEQLKRAGSEAALAAQWRERYEQCMREKEDALAKLGMFSQDGSSKRSSGSANVANGVHVDPSSRDGYASLMQKHADLKEEYKTYRKKAMAALKNASRGGGGGGGQQQLHLMAGVGPSADATLPYLRNLMVQYLISGEPEAKEHMERAITTVLEFSPEERKLVEESRASSTWISGAMSGLWGGAAAPAAGGGSGAISSRADATAAPVAPPAPAPSRPRR